MAKKEIIEAHQAGQLKEAFGTGTAAVVSPIGELSSNTFQMKLNNSKKGPVASWLYEEITALQYGEKPDPYGWIEKL